MGYKGRTPVEKAGLNQDPDDNSGNVTLHTLRHTFASQLAIAGVLLVYIQELMGHQSSQTTLQYAHLPEEHVGKQVLGLPFSGKSKSRSQIGHKVPNISDLPSRKKNPVIPVKPVISRVGEGRWESNPPGMVIAPNWI